jgi:N-acetylmuramic acid 6-phosphate (MurNAc-6-P) etherase
VINLDKIATEQRNQASSHIDQVSTLEMVTIINNEDKKVPEAITRFCRKLLRLWKSLLPIYIRADVCFMWAAAHPAA